MPGRYHLGVIDTIAKICPLYFSFFIEAFKLTQKMPSIQASQQKPPLLDAFNFD